jgi:hypothetical protein
MVSLQYAKAPKTLESSQSHKTDCSRLDLAPILTNFGLKLAFVRTYKQTLGELCQAGKIGALDGMLAKSGVTIIGALN